MIGQQVLCEELISMQVFYAMKQPVLRFMVIRLKGDTNESVFFKMRFLDLIIKTIVAALLLPIKSTRNTWGPSYLAERPQN